MGERATLEDLGQCRSRATLESGTSGPAERNAGYAGAARVGPGPGWADGGSGIRVDRADFQDLVRG